MTIRQVKFAWKHRNLLWKYRGLIRRRKQIAQFALGGAAAAAMICAARRHVE